MFFLGDKFIASPNLKQVYFGNKDILLFNTRVNWNSGDKRVSSSGVIDYGSAYGFSGNGYVKFNTITKEINVAINNAVPVSSNLTGLTILLKNFYDSSVIYRYHLICSSADNVLRTYVAILQDNKQNEITRSSWSTDYGFSSEDNIKYDFDNHKFSFPMLGNTSGKGGGFITKYTIDRDYIPFKVEVINSLSSDLYFAFVRSCIVQN